jgi:hypothetical protein
MAGPGPPHPGMGGMGVFGMGAGGATGAMPVPGMQGPALPGRPMMNAGQGLPPQLLAQGLQRFGMRPPTGSIV